MTDPAEMIGLDFETYGAVNLPKYGLHRYVNNSTFTPLLAGVAWDSAGPDPYTELLDFTQGHEAAEADYELLRDLISDRLIVAHNASFEQAVLGSMGIRRPSHSFIDSAVLARAAGAGGHLAAAAPQLLGINKMAEGADLIQLFSVPGKIQAANESMRFDRRVVLENPEKWAIFGHYCKLDAELGLRLAVLLLTEVSKEELANAAVTMDMNQVGWRVDLDLVEEMQRRYYANLAEIEAEFRTATGSTDLNLNSNKQLTTWCSKRGVRALSFDEAHVERLLAKLEHRLTTPGLDPARAANYQQVAHLMRTKQALGGSSLKKLQTILDQTSEDGRLRDQYLHIGADATYRTSGRGVQMQNLKRLHGEGDDMTELFVPDTEWDNGKLATNLRQVFTASDEQGRLIVGDFSSVESRGLAWQAGEQWKLDAYHQGQDLYKVQAGVIFGIHPDQVTKDQRQIGKVGELSCGYGAGPDAVKSFAEKMGVILSEAESLKLVRDWREANPQVVKYWYALDDALHTALACGIGRAAIPHGKVVVAAHPAPQSLRDQTQNQGLVSLYVSLRQGSDLVLRRVIHGAHEVGRNIEYWKPSERKTGDLWKNSFVNPKTKQVQRYTVYGGKLAGLLTQSLCREVFFDSLRTVHTWVAGQSNVSLVGQFHDEIVLDWVPGPTSLDETMSMLELAMTDTMLVDFPLAAEIKHDYRYIK